MTSCKHPRYVPKSPKGITFRSVWWRSCEENQCPSLSCGSQMRRKAEVLRHVKNQNQLTKKQKYSQLVKYGKTIKTKTSEQRTLQVGALMRECNSGSDRSYASYYSDVPGNTPLLYDPLEPLVNYRAARRAPTSTQRLRLEKSSAIE